MSESLAPEQVDDEWQPLISTPCPVCREVIDAATHVKDETVRPHEGDLSMCVYCGTPVLFTRIGSGLTFRLPTKEEWPEINSNIEVARARVAAIQLAYKRALNGGK